MMILDLQLLSSVNEALGKVCPGELAYETPDLSTLPVNPYQAAECQGYDSS